MEPTAQELEELMHVIAQEVDWHVNNYLKGIKSILAMEQAIEKEVMKLGDKSKSEEVLGVTYEETLQVRIGILQACKEGMAQASLLFDQLFHNLESCLPKIIKKECLLGFVCLLLLARNDPQGYEILEKKGKTALGELRIEEDIKDALCINELGEILQFPYPTHMGKIEALQYFPNRVIKATINIIRKRYVLPKLPIVFFPDDDIKDEMGFTVEFLNRKDAEKEASIMVVEYMSGLSPQAKSQREVGEFLLNKLKSGEIDEYIKQTESGFRIDTRRMQKDSGKPLRSVERFLEGLTKFCHQKQVPSFNS